MVIILMGVLAISTPRPRVRPRQGARIHPRRAEREREREKHVSVVSKALLRHPRGHLLEVMVVLIHLLWF